MAFSVGQTVGDYQVIEVLGSGGMGTVYKVRHLISERLEAMKLVLPELTENPELADRFMREIKVQGKLSHPNIASLHNALRMGNQFLMIMELVEGSTLTALMKHGPVDPTLAIDMTTQILMALEYAHSLGIVHRDIKPANIMLTAARQVKLMDFGIARSMLEESNLTRTGAAVGSIYYMSPEQVQSLPVDARADLYSVGVVLYELVTAVRPITGDTSWAVMNGHIQTIPRSPSSLNPKLPEAFSLAILKALEKAPMNRFQSARAFMEALAAVRSRMPAGSGNAGGVSLQQTEIAPSNWATPPPGHTNPAPSYTPADGPVQQSGLMAAASTPVSGISQPLAARFEPERLEKLTREMAAFVGPVAKVLVNRAAKKAQTWRQLYDALAPEVPEGAERKQFLSKRPL